MEKYDFESKIKMNILMLRYLGLWPKGDTSHTLDLYLLYATLLLAVFLVAHFFFQVVNIFYILNNLVAVTGTLNFLFIDIMVFFKAFFLIRNMTMLKNLLKTLESDMFQPKNCVQKSATEASIWFWKMVYKAFLSVCYGTNVFWAVAPLLETIRTGKRRLPVLAWYPCNTSLSPAYEIIYVHQIISLCFITTVNFNIDTLVTALNVFNGIQFDILCDNLRNLHKLGENVFSYLVKCVRHHQEILSFAKRSNNFQNWILFVQFSVSAVSISMILFQLALVAPLSNEFYTLVFFVLAMIVQIFVFCWFGNEMELKSSSIPYALFECDWTNFPEEIKKDLLFFTLKAQRPVKLSALNLFYLSLDTFITILKTAWSYFAFLYQVSSRKEDE